MQTSHISPSHSHTNAQNYYYYYYYYYYFLVMQPSASYGLLVHEVS
jgi:hypothetical protein